ncbi:hypothetical protein QM012_002670 [Aureobasidium pullulans]|uniref:Uncharacterized protein n=1 Tax=Aureobasidium pullulans TaxID=5580 RepID=A0ABR0TA73_AURPU
MADIDPSSKNPQAATVEDCADSDDERGDSSASKPASNSASKRIRKNSNTKQNSLSKARPASDTGQPEAPPPPPSPPPPPGNTDTASRQPGEPASQTGAKEEHGSRPGPNPLQQDHRAHTFPARPPHGPSPIIRHGPPPSSMPTGHMPPPGVRMIYPPGINFPGGPPPHPQIIPAFDPRAPTTRSGKPSLPHPSMYAPSSVSMPPSLPGVGGPPPPLKLPTRPAIHHAERRRSKISTYDTSSAPFSPDDDEHFSARNLPAKPQHVPGGFESDSYSSESPPDSPEYYDQPRRPAPFQRATTSAVQQIHRTGHSRLRSDYPAESTYGYHHAYHHEPAWGQNTHAEYPEYGEQRPYPADRRGSNATTWTQHTSASDPQHPTYVHYDYQARHGGHPAQEYAAIDYMDRARGHPEERITAETLRQLPGGPRSTRSNHSHRRSQHSMSETSSRYRSAEGSVKLIMPIAAAEDTKIQLSGDMGDREVSFRSINDPGMVEVTIGTVAGKEVRGMLHAAELRDKSRVVTIGSIVSTESTGMPVEHLQPGGRD